MYINFGSRPSIVNNYGSLLSIIQQTEKASFIQCEWRDGVKIEENETKYLSCRTQINLVDYRTKFINKDDQTKI